jgi:hypothetical protein
MASSWLDSWGSSWADSWGEQVTDPNALRGTAAGSTTAGATLTAAAWLAGRAAGSSTAQAYLELDGAVLPAPAVSGGFARVPIPTKPLRVRPREEDEAMMILGLL